MTHSPALSTGLTVNGDDWTRSDGRILARLTQGLFDGWSLRGVDYIVEGSPGQVPYDRLVDHWDIKAEGIVQGVGADEAAQRADFLATRQAMAATMRSTDAYELEVTLEDGSLATIDARPIAIEWGDDGIPTFRQFTAYWRAVSEDWQFEEAGS